TGKFVGRVKGLKGKYTHAPQQELREKKEKSRRNNPNTLGGKGQWRMLAEDLKQDKKDFLTSITELYARVNTSLVTTKKQLEEEDNE
ncbi:hypothetical protein ACEE47_09845, partial [Streptococcus pluranimalium]